MDPASSLELVTEEKVTVELERPAAPAVSKYKRWFPKQWKPIFDEMILYSISGVPLEQIAKKYKYSYTHASTILNSPQAQIIRRQMLESLRKNVLAKQSERLEDLKDISLQRVSELLHDDNLMEKNPFGVADKAITVLKGTGVLQSEGSNNTTLNARNAVFLPPELAKGLLEGISMADKAKQLNAQAPLEVEIVTSEK